MGVRHISAVAPTVVVYSTLALSSSLSDSSGNSSASPEVLWVFFFFLWLTEHRCCLGLPAANRWCHRLSDGGYQTPGTFSGPNRDLSVCICGVEETIPLCATPLNHTHCACLLCIVICAQPELRPPPVVPPGCYFCVEKMFVIVEKSSDSHHENTSAVRFTGKTSHFNPPTTRSTLGGSVRELSVAKTTVRFIREADLQLQLLEPGKELQLLKSVGF